MDLNEIIMEAGTALAQLTVNGTVAKVTDKIKASKTEKNVEKLRNMYEEIINELIYERAEAVRIAQTYKSELDKIEISDDDIKHLQNTVSNLLDILKRISPKVSESFDDNAKEDTSLDVFETVKKLISTDTLKTMQLLGFNFKAAIGEPLTKICAEAISNWGKKTAQGGNSKKNR